MAKKNNKKAISTKFNNSNSYHNNQTDFDYEKLALAIVKAQELSKQMLEKEKTDKLKCNTQNWHKIIGYKEHKADEKWFAGKLLSVRNFFSVFIHFLFFNKKYAKSDAMTYAILQIAMSAIFSACKWILYYISIMYILEFIESFIEPINIVNWFNFLYASVSFIFARIFRIAVFEIDNMKDRNYLITIFSATTCFIAMIIAIIAMFA